MAGNINIVKIDREQLPVIAEQMDQAVEDIKKFIFDDRFSGKYHPARAMAALLRTSSQSHNEKFIDDINHNFMMEKDGCVLFPYKFDFTLHGNLENVIKADWYSGLAQGRALIVYSRKNDKCLADKILNSFETDYITEFMDCGHHYMEYPHQCDALNGHIYALYGIYDYWWHFGGSKAEYLLKEGLR